MPVEFEASVSRGRTILYLAGALIFAAAGIWLSLSADSIARGGRFTRDPGLVQLVGWTGLGFGLLCAIVIARQLFRSGAVMRIGPQGLWWRRWSDETIPWSAFERAAEMRIQRQRFLSLWLRDPEAYRSSTLLGRLAGANKSMGFGDISLTTQGLDRRFDEMVDAVVASAPELFGD